MSRKPRKPNQPEKDRQLLLKDDDSEYGLVTKKLGNGRFMVKLNLQNKELPCRLCGKFRKGYMKRTNEVGVDTVVLAGFRDYDEKTADIIYVYNPAEVRQLKREGRIVEDLFRIAEESEETRDVRARQGNKNEDDCPFNFDEI